MIGPVLSFLLLVLVTIATARIFVAKHWPLWMGICIGILGCWFGSVVGLMTAHQYAWSRASFALMSILLPAAGATLPIIIARVIPLPPKTRIEHYCDRCGNPTKESTPVCEKCAKQ